MAALLVALLVALAGGPARAQDSSYFTVDPVARFYRDGRVTLTGMAQCPATVGFAYIEGSLGQAVGRVSTVTGPLVMDQVLCTGEPEPWTAFVIPSSGKFRGGTANGAGRLVLDGQPGYEANFTVRLTGRR